MDGHIHQQHLVEVNGKDIHLTSGDPNGREILSAAGFDPASEYTLVQYGPKLTKIVLLDGQVDLGGDHTATFDAALSDRAFTFTINEHQYLWGQASLNVLTARLIGAVPDDFDLILEREAQPDLVLDRGGTIDLAEKGAEHMVSKHRDHGHVIVTVFATGGIYPEDGALRLPVTQLISDILALTASELKLTDTSDWVVSCNGRDLDPSLSYQHYGLTGEVAIDWHAREGGGGNA